jgi:hypothetical protein|tara:strand:- start:299 stop:499 length:201 start_codon:yes stop_codon:yes gene_type:complete
MIQVEGQPNLYRDEDTGAIVNCDTNGYNQYIRLREQKSNEKKELDRMKSDIEEIKSLLKEVIKIKS